MRLDHYTRQGALGSENHSVTKVATARESPRLKRISGFPTVPRVGATPVPIPNTEVKPHFGDGTAEFPRWESSATVGPLERRSGRLWSFPGAVSRSGDYRGCSDERPANTQQPRRLVRPGGLRLHRGVLRAVVRTFCVRGPNLLRRRHRLLLLRQSRGSLLGAHSGDREHLDRLIVNS